MSDREDSDQDSTPRTPSSAFAESENDLEEIDPPLVDTEGRAAQSEPAPSRRPARLRPSTSETPRAATLDQLATTENLVTEDRLAELKEIADNAVEENDLNILSLKELQAISVHLQLPKYTTKPINITAILAHNVKKLNCRLNVQL